MTTRVLIIGGYGNFGSFITKKLAQDPALQIIIAGRSLQKCQQLAAQYLHIPNPVQFHVCDIQHDFPAALAHTRPNIVIHTSGPFQGQGYDVATACIDHGCHYIDLADSRAFVAGISSLDAQAQARNVMVISGASSVPTLTSAIIDHYLPQFANLHTVDYGITTAQRTNTGLATTQAVLSYTGKPFTTLINGIKKTIYGWQGLTAHKYPELGWRLLGNCDVPDLELFPAHYPQLKTIRFRAGLEISFTHLSLWALSWLVRWKVLRDLSPAAETLLKLSRLLDPLGSDQSAFHMDMTGTDTNGKAIVRQFHLVAKSGHGPFIPSMPAIILTRMIAQGKLHKPGAFAGMGVIPLQDYLDAMADLDIRVIA